MSLRTKYNLTFNKRLPSSGNSKQVVLGEEDVVVVSSAPLDFNGFPNLLTMPNGDLLLTWGKSQQHGGEWREGKGMYGKISADGGETFGDDIVIYLAPDPELFTAYSVANCGVTQTGRLVLFGYLSDGGGGRQPYTAISDSLTEPISLTWVKMTTDYDTLGYQLDLQGSLIYYEGIYYKTGYGRLAASGNRHCMLYKNENNCDQSSWVKVSNISAPAASPDYEEPCIDQYQKIIFGILRSDVLERSDFIYSTSGGVGNWSAPINIGFPSVGKNPVCISPNGTILVVGRDFTTNRFIFKYSNDYGHTWSVTAFASELTVFYTYADILWEDGRFVCVWSGDENFPLGPCNVYRTYFYEEDL